MYYESEDKILNNQLPIFFHTEKHYICSWFLKLDIIMKKRITLITFAILWLSAFSLQAGIRIGLKGGVNLANAVFSTDAVKPDNFTGFQVGPIIEISSLSGLGLDAAILYSESGIKFTDGLTITNYDEKVSTLDIPVNLKQKFSLANILGCYLSAGPYVSFKLNAQGNLSQNKDLVISEWKSKQLGVGVNFGAGFELLKHLQVGVNYQIALNDDYKNDVSLVDEKGNIVFSNFTAKTRIWSITAAYFF